MKIKELLTKDETNNIKKMIEAYDKKSEFEVSLFSNRETSSSLLTLERFNHLDSAMTIMTQKNEGELSKKIKIARKKKEKIIKIN